MTDIVICADEPLAAVAHECVVEAGFRVRMVTANVREVLRRYDVGTEAPLMVLDDGILRANSGLVDQIARLSGPKVLIGMLADRGVARRALLLGAVDVVEPTTIVRALPSILARVPLSNGPEEQRTRVIAIYSAKGGVGKSTVALNLAVALGGLSEFPTALVDADLLGDLATMLRTTPGVSLADFVDACEGGMAPTAVLQSLTRIKKWGLTLLSAPVHPQQSERIRSDHVARLLTLLRAEHAFIVVDLGTNLHEVTLSVLDHSDDIVVLAAPEQVTVSAVAKSLRILRRLYPTKLQVVLNRGDTVTGMTAEDVSHRLDQPVSRILPSGGTAPVKAANQGRPLVIADPRNRLSQAIAAWAHNLVTEQQGNQRRRKRWLARRRC